MEFLHDFDQGRGRASGSVAFLALFSRYSQGVVWIASPALDGHLLDGSQIIVEIAVLVGRGCR
jgi:hypothetical protein